MRGRWLLCIAFGLLGCGSDDSEVCPDVGSGGPTFTPDSAKSGETVVMSFPLDRAGSSGARCPVQLTLTCGAKKTEYQAKLNGKGATGPLVLDCSGESGPVSCTDSYSYQTANSGAIGFGTGPTCTP